MVEDKYAFRQCLHGKEVYWEGKGGRERKRDRIFGLLRDRAERKWVDRLCCDPKTFYCLKLFLVRLSATAT